MSNNEPDISHRVAAAVEMRRLSHAMVGHHLSQGTLNDIIEFARSTADLAEAGAKRNSSLEFMKDPTLRAEFMENRVVDIIEASNANGLFGHSMVSGQSNPMSVAVEYSFTDDAVTATVTLGPAFEGAPGMAHGGVIAAIIDETMGAVLPLVGTLAFTGELNLSYRSPTPIGEELKFKASLKKRDGRKLYLECVCTQDDNILVVANGLFIAHK